MGVPPVKNGPHPFLFLTTAQKRFYIVGRKPKGRFFWFVGVPPVKNGPHPYLFFEDRPKCDFANQKNRPFGFSAPSIDPLMRHLRCLWLQTFVWWNL